MRSSDEEPLFGVKVLDLCRVVSGPFATMHLGDLGADVVKIEDPRSGDESRRYGPPFVNSESSYFLAVNRNKRSCAVDLKPPAGMDAVIELAQAADVVIDNFRPVGPQNFSTKCVASSEMSSERSLNGGSSIGITEIR